MNEDNIFELWREYRTAFIKETNNQEAMTKEEILDYLYESKSIYIMDKFVTVMDAATEKYFANSKLN